MDAVTISLPAHAIRYLRGMCKRERTALAKTKVRGYTLQMDAAYDSLGEIEEALPEGEPWEIV